MDVAPRSRIAARTALMTTWTGSLENVISYLASCRKLTASRKTKPSVVSQNGKRVRRMISGLNSAKGVTLRHRYLRADSARSRK